MQPLTISFWSGLLVRPRCWCAWRIASIDSSLAESMNAQVFTTRTSASSARDVISIPRCKTLPSMISASTRFLAQPRLIMPTFALRPTFVPFLVLVSVQLFICAAIMLRRRVFLFHFDGGDHSDKTDPKLKAWPRGLRPLRCSLASLRMTDLV